VTTTNGEFNLQPTRRDHEPKDPFVNSGDSLGHSVDHAGNRAEMPAKSGCSNASLKGRYGLHATGIDEPGDVLFAAVGVFTFDGAGNLAGDVFFRTPGSTIHAFPVGTYTVHPDCTVSDTFGGNTHESVIVDEGRGYLIVNTQAGVISGEAHKQFPRHPEEN
jgi:hypothetical protein